MPIDIRLLGSLDVHIDGQVVDVASPKLQILLAALVLRSGTPVPVEKLAEMIWGERQPDNPTRAVQLYVTRLRAQVKEWGADISISTHGPAYQMDVPPGSVDVSRFERLVSEAHQAAREGDLDGEAASLARALAEWRGEALADVPSDALHREVVPLLREQFLRAQERCVDIELRRDRHEAVADHLLVLTARYPTREKLWAQLITVLHASGRRSEALAAYQQLRRNLSEALGIDPCEGLQRLHVKILTGREAAADALPSLEPLVVPRQLPPNVGGFTGRAPELQRLEALVGRERDADNSVPIGLIVGMPGIGKTSLALYWAHRMADRFPDGQLWIDLRGHGGGSVTSPEHALTRFLRALGVPGPEIPATLDDQCGLYRSLVNGRQLLVVLDNAAGLEQVRPLLPGGPGCVVIVTSRHRLSGLVAVEGADALVLDPLSRDDARHLLSRRLGAARLAAEPEAVEDIIGLCTEMPLALAVVAARAAVHPHFALGELASELRAARTGAGRSGASAEMGAAVSWSYYALTAKAAQMFRMLSVSAGPDISLRAAASVMGVPVSGVRPLLAELSDAYLVTEHIPGRYSFHDLMRAHAANLSLEHDTDEDRTAATHRLLDHYLHTAHAAALKLGPQRDPVALPPVPAGVSVAPIAGLHEAQSWFAAEHVNLLAATARTDDAAFLGHIGGLAWAISEYLARRGHVCDWAATQRAALLAADRTGDGQGQARAHRGLAHAYMRMRRLKDAQEHCLSAFSLSRDFGDHIGRAYTHLLLGMLRQLQGRQREALTHNSLALELFRLGRDRVWQARALTSVGWDYAVLGDVRRGLEHCDQAISIVQEIDDLHCEADIWNNLGYAHGQLGDHGQAGVCYRHALERFRTIGDCYNEAIVHVHIGDSYLALGLSEAARVAWEEALRIHRSLGYRGGDLVATRLRRLDAAR
ncbi:AfsR/SARP family transcriptional regulator [Nonomuraea rhizosphaerae]|uniref:AfsR/SARP family transcriptional regulator n=1 Tax=Nonomuraea rhizosphaerae TaxID=2665663 RepID=UPI001C5DF220|nr:BTAD domain-containing putative transcriptional regulator [Nonomuraea rhizosphaerae]